MSDHAGHEHAEIADPAAADRPVARAALWQKPSDLGRGQHGSGAIGGVDQDPTGRDRDGERFLHEHMLAGRQKGQTNFVVRVQGREHDGGVDLIVGRHLPKVVGHAGYLL